MAVLSLKITPETYPVYLTIVGIEHHPLMRVNQMHLMIEPHNVCYLEEREFHDLYKYVNAASKTKPTPVERIRPITE